MSILNYSVNQMGLATDLMRGVAQAEQAENARRENLAAAQDAQRMQTIGMIGGAATPYALDYLGGLGGGAPAAAVSDAIPAGGMLRTTGVPQGTLGLPQMNPVVGGPEVGSAAGLQGVSTPTANALGISTTAPQMSLTQGAQTAAAQGLGTGTSAAAGTASGTAASAAGTSSTAAAATGVPGTMSSLAGSLGSIAAPVGIALGIGFLLNKLFG